MTDEELKALVGSLAVAQKETDKQFKELGVQIGGLGNKFGSFTEGMAYPSLQKLLRERFRMDVIAANVSARIDGECLELDVMASAILILALRVAKIY